MSSLRETFLKTEWPRYPSATGLKKAGRILALNTRSITLFRGWQVPSPAAPQLRPFRLATKSIKNWPAMKSILVVGDIIGFQKDGQCVLLTPWSDNSQVGPSSDIGKKLLRQHQWNQFINAVRRFFDSRHFMAMQTPTLVDNPGPEPTIDVFKTTYKKDRQRLDKYLITSPELHLKKLLSQSLTPIYELTKVYRNNEHSPKHRPEFWMLEWYRPFVGLDAIVQDVKDLIVYLGKELKIKKTKLSFASTSFCEVLKKQYQFDFRPDTTGEELKRLLQMQKIYFSDSMSLDDLFTLVNIELVEPKLDSKKIVFLCDYPPYAAALAKVDFLGWAQRFEVYWRGLELGNAFHELNDPDIQEQRLADDNLKKSENGLDVLPSDLDFLKYLRQGLPPSSGISIGLERLFMALYQEQEIRSLNWFSAPD